MRRKSWRSALRWTMRSRMATRSRLGNFRYMPYVARDAVFGFRAAVNCRVYSFFSNQWSAYGLSLKHSISR